MDAEQETRHNPYGMDEDCRNCPGLCDQRERVVHGYGDVGADFVFVAESPSAASEDAGVPLVGDDAGERFQHILGSVGLNYSLPSSTEPELENAYVTYLTRCRHPDRAATDGEVRECEPYLNADIRMINPEVLVPVGQRALTELGEEYTTNPAESMDVEDLHASTVRGRGFELVPMVHPGEQSDEQTEAWIDFFLEFRDTDYRQTKGRRNR
jgi:uracil-DNA glycosylase family 4